MVGPVELRRPRQSLGEWEMRNLGFKHDLNVLGPQHFDILLGSFFSLPKPLTIGIINNLRIV